MIFWLGCAGGGRTRPWPLSGWALRVVLLRTGVVLGRAGGALAQMLPPFQMGVGGPVGLGPQDLPVGSISTKSRTRSPRRWSTTVIWVR